MDGTEIMVTAAEVAARDGVSPQAVTKLVRKLVAEHGLPVERDGRERIARFSLAHFDHLRGNFASSAKVDAARRPGRDDRYPVDPPLSNAMSRDEALRQEAWLKVGREKLRRQEATGRLIRADLLSAALAECGQEIKSQLARLQNKADDMALAVSREGAHGLRVMLREVAFEIGDKLSDRLLAIGNTAPATDPALEDEDL